MNIKSPYFFPFAFILSEEFIFQITFYPLFYLFTPLPALFLLGVRSLQTSKAAARNMSSDFFFLFHLAFLIVLWKLYLP